MAYAKILSVECLQLLLLLCLFLPFIGVNAHNEEEGALNDLKALIEFKNCITSDPLLVFKNWDAAADASNACNWTGITCSTRRNPGRVVKISLQNATLRGSLSPYIGNLSVLQVLHISGNSFSGTIPSSLGRLRSLKFLNLCDNEFEGGIPSQLGNLSSLQFLYLCQNSFSGEIPRSLARLQDLKELNLFQNQLGGEVPSWLGALNKLDQLYLGENNFHGVIPAELGNLSSSLTFLDLDYNHLTGVIPCWLAGLYRLTDIYLHQNKLSGTLRACLRNLTALRSISLSGNNLQGDLPTWMGSFYKLQSLGLFYNRFTGNIPQSWQNLTHLQSLGLHYNRLSGIPPSWLGTICTQLRRFYISSNYFSSGVRLPWQPIPILNALSNCSLLTDLRISDNHLTGTLPPTFGSSLPNLQYLHLFENFISGNIPSSVGNLSSLVELDLYDNVLKGTIPPQIANMKSLQGLSLQRNKLQGNIPSEMSFINKSLAYLHLSENRLSGSIPANIGKLVNLRQLHLDRNLLFGKIPSDIGNCPVLEALVLSENNLSGSIPPEVAGLKTIVFQFDLSANALTGEVPPEIAGLQRTQFINLSRNQLSGNIASYMDSWLDARRINLSFNNFNGNLSNAIGNKLTQLQTIDLSGNNFTGPVPASLLNHSTLQFLNFSYNNFDGAVLCLHSYSTKLRLTRLSFLGNPYLCGTCFGLGSCGIYSHSNKRRILKIVLSIVFGLLLLVVTGIVFFSRIKISRREIPRIGEKFLKISLEELQRATDNFSTSNLIGEGTHGKVYRGVLRSGDVAAVKCFSSTSHPGTAKSFKKECHALRRARHRNVLKVITVVWSEEVKALVMPYMSNGSLHSLLHSRDDGQLLPLKLPIRLRILTELANGLSYLHHDCDLQIIHCDIKPENVLLDDDMTVKLSDFAISSLRGDFDGPPISSSLAIRGSVGYVAPEYGTGQRISLKGDVYSFGVVILEVITRSRPTHETFSGDLTLPLWVSRALEEKSGDERRQMLKRILMMADEDGGGIQMDNYEEMSVVESILSVGVRCTCQDALVRPTMKEVEAFLQSICIENVQNPRTLPRNLEEVISIVESQPPLYPRRAEGESSTFSN